MFKEHGAWLQLVDGKLMTLERVQSAERLCMTDEEFPDYDGCNRFGSASFVRVKFTELKPRTVDFKKSKFETCQFVNCKFVDANFSGAEFEGCTFLGCSFAQCRFRGSSLVRCDFMGCDFHDVSFEAATLTEVQIAGEGWFVSFQFSLLTDVSLPRFSVVNFGGAWIAGIGFPPRDQFVNSYPVLDMATFKHRLELGMEQQVDRHTGFLKTVIDALFLWDDSDWFDVLGMLGNIGIAYMPPTCSFKLMQNWIKTLPLEEGTDNDASTSNTSAS